MDRQLSWRRTPSPNPSLLINLPTSEGGKEPSKNYSHDFSSASALVPLRNGQSSSEGCELFIASSLLQQPIRCSLLGLLRIMRNSKSFAIVGLLKSALEEKWSATSPSIVARHDELVPPSLALLKVAAHSTCGSSLSALLSHRPSCPSIHIPFFR